MLVLLRYLEGLEWLLCQFSFGSLLLIVGGLAQVFTSWDAAGGTALVLQHVLCIYNLPLCPVASSCLCSMHCSFWKQCHCQGLGANETLMLGCTAKLAVTATIGLVYSCLAFRAQTTVGFAQFAYHWCFCFSLHFSLRTYFHYLQYGLV